MHHQTFFARCCALEVVWLNFHPPCPLGESTKCWIECCQNQSDTILKIKLVIRTEIVVQAWWNGKGKAMGKSLDLGNSLFYWTDYSSEDRDYCLIWSTRLTFITRPLQPTTSILSIQVTNQATDSVPFQRHSGVRSRSHEEEEDCARRDSTAFLKIIWMLLKNINKAFHDYKGKKKSDILYAKSNAFLFLYNYYTLGDI